ncbi:MAG: hypothetical protein EBR33_08890 [Synechococcaceae bacterium WB4_1_0192]|nr:hypothetical protein [Synechococcaceae bacterium WB4_1_0192]
MRKIKFRDGIGFHKIWIAWGDWDYVATPSRIVDSHGAAIVVHQFRIKFPIRKIGFVVIQFPVGIIHSKVNLFPSASGESIPVKCTLLTWKQGLKSITKLG